MELVHKFLEEALEVTGISEADKRVVRHLVAKNELWLAYQSLEVLGDTYIEGSEAEACFWRPMAKAAAIMLNASYESAGHPPAGAS